MSSYDNIYVRLFDPNRHKAAELVSKVLNGAPKGPVVDIGGGTGDTIARLKKMEQEKHYILVEPCPMMAGRAKVPDKVILATADHFGAKYQEYENQVGFVLCQEMIHFVEDPSQFFKNIYRKLKRGGSLMVITRPLEVQFPFGAHGQEAWRRCYRMSPHLMSKALYQVGFTVEQTFHSFPVTLPLNDWLAMVGEGKRHPLFSNMVSLSESQKLQEFEEIRALYRGRQEISFLDEQIFLVASKDR